jgi:hypothetical protein
MMGQGFAPGGARRFFFACLGKYWNGREYIEVVMNPATDGLSKSSCPRTSKFIPRPRRVGLRTSCPPTSCVRAGLCDKTSCLGRKAACLLARRPAGPDRPGCTAAQGPRKRDLLSRVPADALYERLQARSPSDAPTPGRAQARSYNRFRCRAGRKPVHRGPCIAARARRISPKGGVPWMAAIFPTGHGGPVGKTRSARADPEHRDVRRARYLGCPFFLWVFFGQAKKTHSAHRAETLLSEKSKGK